MHSYSTERVKAYRTFKSLDPADPLVLVRHYEQHEKLLDSLDSEQWFDCFATYTDALFEAEMFRKHLVVAEYLLEVIITQNFTTHHGQDIYQHTLLRKACTHSHLGDQRKAQETIETLIRINPEHKAARYVLANLLLKTQPRWYRNWTGYYIGIILLSSFLFVGAGVLYFCGSNLSQICLISGATLLLLALGTMAGTKLWHTWQSYAYPRHLARNLLRIKRSEV
jgi:hypothetical protein